MTYQEQIKSPQWQKKRLKILERDNFTCKCCGEKENTLNVHHIFYIKDQLIYEYQDAYLITLCDDCHKYIHFLMEELQSSIVFHFENDLKESCNLSAYIKALYYAVQMSNSHVWAFNNASKYNEE